MTGNLRTYFLLILMVVSTRSSTTAVQHSNSTGMVPPSSQYPFQQSQAAANANNPWIQNRVRRFPADLMILGSDGISDVPQELVTQVEVGPEFGQSFVQIDDDDDFFDDSNERKALFIRRIDDFRDRTLERRKQRQHLSQRPLRKLLNLRNFLRGARRQNSTAIFPNRLTPRQNDDAKSQSEIEITKSENAETIQGLEMFSISGQKRPTSLVQLSSIEDDEVLINESGDAFTLHSLEDLDARIETIAHDEVFGLRIPKINNSVQHMVITGQKRPNQRALSDRQHDFHFVKIESSEDADFDDLFDDDLSLEIPLVISSTKQPGVPRSEPDHVLVTIPNPDPLEIPSLSVIPSPKQPEVPRSDEPNHVLVTKPNSVPLEIPALPPKPHMKIVISAETNATHASLNIPRNVAQKHPQQVRDFIHRFRNKMKKPVVKPDTHTKGRDLPTERDPQYQRHRNRFEKDDDQIRSMKSSFGQHLEQYGRRYSTERRRFPVVNVETKMNRPSALYQVPSDHNDYAFSYEISEDDVQLGHEETRAGGRVDGEYHVLLPNGLRQIVTYYADETGYHPTIRYEPPIQVPPRKVVKPSQNLNVIRDPAASHSASPSTMIDVLVSPPNGSPSENTTENRNRAVAFSNESLVGSASSLGVFDVRLGVAKLNHDSGYVSLKESEVVSGDGDLGKKNIAQSEKIRPMHEITLPDDLPYSQTSEKSTPADQPDDNTARFIVNTNPPKIEEAAPLTKIADLIDMAEGHQTITHPGNSTFDMEIDPIKSRSPRRIETTFSDRKKVVEKRGLMSMLAPSGFTDRFAAKKDELPTSISSLFSKLPRSGKRDTTSSNPRTVFSKFTPSRRLRLPSRSKSGASLFPLTEKSIIGLNRINENQMKALGTPVFISVPEAPWSYTRSSKLSKLNLENSIGNFQHKPHNKHNELISPEFLGKENIHFGREIKLPSKIRSGHPSVKDILTKPIPKDFKRTARSSHENGRTQPSNSVQLKDKGFLPFDNSCFLYNKCFTIDDNTEISPIFLHRLPYSQQYNIGP